MNDVPSSLRERMEPLSAWTVIVLRAAHDATTLRRAIQKHGAKALFLPALRLAPAADLDAARRELRIALRAPQIVFTSPAAVRFAAVLSPLRTKTTQRLYAVGEGTARALARRGLDSVRPEPGAMHSEGLLALPDLSATHGVRGGEVGLVTAPGGRGVIASGLRQRGVQVLRADVYRRLPPRFDRRHFAALRACPSPRALLLTSAEALHGTLAALPAELGTRLRESLVVASSPRLVDAARALGFDQTLRATSPMPQSLLAALAQHASDSIRPASPDRVRGRH